MTRSPISLRVVKAVEQVNAAGTSVGEAAAELACELGVAARHERGRFLVADLHEADFVLMRSDRLHDPIDAIAGHAEDHIDAPGCECFYERIPNSTWDDGTFR
jgi:hypothetical protein